MSDRPDWAIRKALNRAASNRLRKDQRDPRQPLTRPSDHPMGERLCASCGLLYPWRTFQTRAGSVPHCLPCREAPS